jgi:hypothetical protein
MGLFRRFATACLVGSLAVLSTVATAQADTAVPGLEVSADPAGDVVVSASADPASWPYLQVKLARAGWVARPYETMMAIDPAPVPNTGGSVDITVPTWGLSDVDGAFVLLGCASGDPATCSTLLAEQDRRIVQTVPATASLEVPEQPVFIPEEQVRVSVHNAGGGEMVANLTDLNHPGFTTLPNDTTTVYDAFPNDSENRTLQVRRCSTLASRALYCEPPAASQDVAYVNNIPVEAVFDKEPRLTLNPEWHGSSLDIALYSTPVAHQSTWSLYDEQGSQVLGPIAVTTGTHGLDEFRLSPGAEAESLGLRLADGLYTVRFSVTVTKGDLTRTGTQDRAIELLNDPPVDQPQIRTARRLWRDGHRLTTPYFEVASYPGSWDDGILRLRDSRGRVVESARVDSPCSYDASSCQPWKLDFDRLLGAPLPGRYDVELKMPDSWGRLSVTHLGQVEVQDRIRVARTVVATAAQALKSRHGKTRVYQLRIPSFRALDWIGSVDGGVDATSAHPDGLTAMRIPDVSNQWVAGEHVEDLRGKWRDIRMMSMPEDLPSQVDLQGKPVQIRVQGDPVKSRVDRVRIRVHGYVWRSPRA